MRRVGTRLSENERIMNSYATKVYKSRSAPAPTNLKWNDNKDQKKLRESRKLKVAWANDARATRPRMCYSMTRAHPCFD